MHLKSYVLESGLISLSALVVRAVQFSVVLVNLRMSSND